MYVFWWEVSLRMRPPNLLFKEKIVDLCVVELLSVRGRLKRIFVSIKHYTVYLDEVRTTAVYSLRELVEKDYKV